MTDQNEDPKVRQVLLERMTWACRQDVPKALADRLTVEQIADMVTGRMVYMLRASIYAQQLDHQVVRYPADWWQGFKQRFFPAWALRRWPVLETVKTMRLFAWYPNMEIPGQRDQLLIQIVDGQPGVTP